MYGELGPARRFAPSGMTAMFVGCKSGPARTRTSGRAALTDAGVDGGARADRNFSGKARLVPRRHRRGTMVKLLRAPLCYWTPLRVRVDTTSQ